MSIKVKTLTFTQLFEDIFLCLVSIFMITIILQIDEPFTAQRAEFTIILIIAYLKFFCNSARGDFTVLRNSNQPLIYFQIPPGTKESGDAINHELAGIRVQFYRIRIPAIRAV